MQTLLTLETPQPPIELQEYVPISYNEPHTHLPILWRVMTKHGSSSNGPIGNAYLKYTGHMHPYAYVYLDRVFQYKKYAKELGDSPRLLSKWAGKQIWDTYMHEFFHLYFDARFDDEDTYNYVLNKETKKMVKYNYEYTYSRRWEHNERIIDKLAEVLTKIFFEDPEFNDQAQSWYALFRDYDQSSLSTEDQKSLRSEQE